jgi:tRNA nucleotidyltransferase/poly(A) polymerase
VEDPLRMLRVVQFAARFDFEIEAATLVAIQQHAHLIKTITAERIVTELDKIYYKGSKQKGLSILVETGLFEQIFGQVYVASFLMPIFLDKDITRADFYFILMQFMATPDVFFAKTLKGDTTTTKAIAAIVVVRDGLKEAITKHQKRFLTLDAIRKSKLVLESYIVSHLHGYEEVVREFKSGQMPCGETDLAITGDMMITEKGYVQGKALGDKRKELLGAVITDKCQNTPEGLFALC